MQIFDKNTAIKTASELLKIQAVKLSPENPFTWASGIKSPIYCDNRKLLSFPQTRNFIKNSLAELVKSQFPDVQVIAGVATGAIAAGVLVADILNLPFVYIRAEAKKHGLGNRIEGLLESGKKVVIIEDLISTGGSSLTAFEAVREQGNPVLGMCAIFTYGLPVAKENFAKADCNLSVLTDFETLTEYALSEKIISNESIDILKNWQKTF